VPLLLVVVIIIVVIVVQPRGRIDDPHRDGGMLAHDENEDV